MGYGRWPTANRLERMVSALKRIGVRTLVDIRLSPCASSLNPESNYGPRDWHLQSEEGLAAHLARHGIANRWFVELGNPQKNDPAMAILRSHIATNDAQWPVNRGLERLRKLLQQEEGTCCLLCACASADKCHRQLVAQALALRYFAELEVRDLSDRRELSARFTPHRRHPS